MTWIPLENHWNYTQGEQLKVQVMTNCHETELFLNNKSLGRKQLPPRTQAPELTWDVDYQPGTLVAIGYNHGAVVSTDTLATAGAPSKLLVDISKSQLNADGMDLAYLNYRVVDSHGNLCTADVPLTFDVRGQGTNQGVANDDMMSHEPWQANSRTTYQGRCQLIVRSKAAPGKITVKAKAKGLKPLTTIINVK